MTAKVLLQGMESPTGRQRDHTQVNNRYQTIRSTEPLNGSVPRNSPSTIEKDYNIAKMWWRKFVQYIKMTKDLELSSLTNNKEILPQYRDQ